MKRTCQSVAKSSGEQCKKHVLPGSRYCLFHTEKRVWLYSGVFGAILSGVFALVWNRYVPSPELAALRRLDNAVSDLSSRYFADKSNFEALDEMADALSRLEEKTPKDPTDEVMTNAIEAFAAWHGQYPTVRVTVTLANAATPNTRRVARNTVELLNRAGVATTENESYMFLLTTPKNSVVLEFHPANRKSILGLIEALSIYVEGNPGVRFDENVGRDVINIHLQGVPRFTKSGKVFLE